MVHARTSSGPAVKKYSSWSAAYPALMIFAKALKKKKEEWIQFIQHIHIKQLNAPSNQFMWKGITYFEDATSTFKQSSNCSSLSLFITLFRRTTFLLQNHKDSILICLFGRLQKHGININHPIRHHSYLMQFSGLQVMKAYLFDWNSILKQFIIVLQKIMAKFSPPSLFPMDDETVLVIVPSQKYT